MGCSEKNACICGLHWGKESTKRTRAFTTPLTPDFEALLQRDIDQIRTKLLEMAALDEQALTRAFQAFLKRDRQLAYSVILHDQDVDASETERSEEHTSELQSLAYLVCRLLLEKKKIMPK